MATVDASLRPGSSPHRTLNPLPLQKTQKLWRHCKKHPSEGMKERRRDEEKVDPSSSGVERRHCWPG